MVEPAELQFTFYQACALAVYFAVGYFAVWYSYHYLWTDAPARREEPETPAKKKKTAAGLEEEEAEGEPLHAPHPWHLEVSESYIFPLDASKADRARLEPHLTSADDKRDFLESGLGAVMLVRYANSPVGPYDELLLIPGAFRSKGQRPAAAGGNASGATDADTAPLLCDRRVTRIFVSTNASVRNGRRNWGIRKELAHFEWKETGYFTRRVAVSLLGGGARSSAVSEEKKACPPVVFEASFYRTPCFFPASTVPIPRWVMPSIVERAIDENGNALLCPVKQQPFWLATKLDITSGIFGLCSRLEIHAVGEAHFPDLDKLGGMLGFGLCGTGRMKFCSPVKVEDDEEPLPLRS